MTQKKKKKCNTSQLEIFMGSFSPGSHVSPILNESWTHLPMRITRERRNCACRDTGPSITCLIQSHVDARIGIRSWLSGNLVKLCHGWVERTRLSRAFSSSLVLSRIPMLYHHYHYYPDYYIYLGALEWSSPDRTLCDDGLGISQYTNTWDQITARGVVSSSQYCY